MPMTPDMGPYDRPIQDLERQARDLEVQARDIGRKLSRLHGILSNLRDLAAAERRASLTVQSPEAQSNGQPSLPPPIGLEPPRHAASSYQKGDIIKMVLAALEEHPGMRSSELGDLLKDKVTTGTKNPRKLIINAVSYLASTKRVRKQPKGGWEVIRP
jgi:hypothetical protein